MKYVITGILLMVCNCFVFAQKSKNIVAEGTYTTKFETNNKDLFVIKCIELAKINAIENAFGKVIMQGNSTYIQNSNNNSKKESYNSFNFISDTYVNGEWIKDIEAPIISYLTSSKDKNGNDEVWISVKVHGYVNEIVSAPINFKFSPLSCDNNTNCKTEEIKEKQDVFFYFQAPVSGYLAM